MMKNRIFSILLIVVALLCAPNDLFSQETWKGYQQYASVTKPATNFAMWSGPNNAKLYDNCIIGLHISGFELDPQKTAAGVTNSLIVTNPLDVTIPFGKGSFGTFSLSILVYKTVENNMAINIQVNGAKLTTGMSASAQKTARAWVNNKISEDVDKFMSQLATVQGKPDSTATAAINFEGVIGGK